MADRVIDYDKGVLINNHPQTGMDVFMYVEKPGEYLTAHGKPVPESIAAEAGFDVEKLGKDKVRLDRKKQAAALIDKELSDEKDVKETVVKAKEGWTLVSIGLGRHHLKDPDGNQITANSLSLEQGEKLLEAMAAVSAPKEDASADAKGQTGPKKNA